MLVKVAILFTFLTATAAIALQKLSIAKSAHVEHHYPALYEYEYSVHDEHNGDIKQQKENRDGDKVHGFYSVVQPDGVRRVVEYTVDKEHGFNAVVRYEGHPHTPAVPLKSPVTKVLYNAPAPVSKVHISAPVAKVTFSGRAPVAYAAAPVAKVAYASPAHVDYPPAVSKISFTSHLGPVYSYHH